MWSRLSTICIALLLFFTLTYATARPEPTFSDATPIKINNQRVDAELEKVMVEDLCEGVGKEECLERRTLAAHLDYIYTQKHKP
ncbi:phytosulfokines 3 [Quercus suber]|uniref:Phytosulfokine n=1 Tax=Quercus suber TaxID=58331 RepID=A0AAW0KP61_QUESU|nr:phytosulfokines 3-like [Quercus suber]POF20824.1 phytosulfokines 3 [Quercus suber]